MWFCKMRICFSSLLQFFRRSSNGDRYKYLLLISPLFKPGMACIHSPRSPCSLTQGAWKCSLVCKPSKSTNAPSTLLLHVQNHQISIMYNHFYPIALTHGEFETCNHHSSNLAHDFRYWLPLCVSCKSSDITYASPTPL